MKIQRNTLILALAAFGLASSIYIQQQLTAPDASGEIRAEGSEPLFDFDEADVTQFTIRRPDLTLSLEKREAESAESKPAETAALGQPDWNLTAPEQIPASDGAVAFLLNLLATGDRRDSFSIPSSPERLAEFGLDQPTAQVDVTLADGTTRSLSLGDSNFDDSGLYAAGDLPTSQASESQSSDSQSPESQSIEVFLVDSSLEPALLRPLEEWRYTAELPDDSTGLPDDSVLPSEASSAEADRETDSNDFDLPSEEAPQLPIQVDETGEVLLDGTESNLESDAPAE